MMENLKKEDGIALILALVMLLILSALAVTISFMSNVDFQMMSSYKRGQEAFLAAERCVQEAKRQLEVAGVTTPFFLLQGGVFTNISLQIGEGGVNCTANPERCSVCRTGRRGDTGPAPFPQIPAVPSKGFGRPPRDTQLPSGGVGSQYFPIVVTVTGKDAGDKDKNDLDPDINTGTEISVGYEIFIPGGDGIVY